MKIRGWAFKGLSAYCISTTKLFSFLAQAQLVSHPPNPYDVHQSSKDLQSVSLINQSDASPMTRCIKKKGVDKHLQSLRKHTYYQIRFNKHCIRNIQSIGICWKIMWQSLQTSQDKKKKKKRWTSAVLWQREHTLPWAVLAARLSTFSPLGITSTRKAKLVGTVSCCVTVRVFTAILKRDSGDVFYLSQSTMQCIPLLL